MKTERYQVILLTESKAILLYKIGDTTEWQNYKALSLASHAAKIFTSKIKNRIKTKIQ